MSNPQSLLLPGETLGAVQAQTPSNSLLQPGETLGSAVPQDTAVQPANNQVAQSAASQGGASYQAAPDESTPEGYTAAVARREKENPTLTDVGKGSGEALGDIWDSVKSMVTHPVDTAGGLIGAGNQVYGNIKDSIPIIHAYDDARSQGKGVIESLNAANAKAKEISDAHSLVKQRMDEFKKQPGVATIRALGNAATIAATIYDGGKLNPSNLTVPENAGVTHVFDPETGTLAPITDAAEPLPQPSRITQAIKGARVAQPGAQAAVRNAVRSSVESTGAADESTLANIENQPLLKGNGTILDEHLSNLAENEKAAYKKMDDTAGFDVKAEKQQLANDQYKLKQLGNTDTDVTQRGNLIESINDSQQRIADAEAKMKEAGVDPAEADGIHKQRIAGTDFKKALVKSTNPDGSVNIDSLLNGSKNLRFTKYGDRLQQFFGSKEAADNYITQLEQMQKLGAHAVKMQRVAKIIGGLALGGYGLHKFGQVAEALIP
jgi:hypothetical protein